jgi:hypothetical protein
LIKHVGISNWIYIVDGLSVSSDFLDTDKAQSTMIDEADERVFLNTVYLTGICPEERWLFLFNKVIH